MSARSAVALAFALAGSWTAAAPPALALEPGVHVSPGSPAGKEYTAPLSSLRGLGSGHPSAENQPGPVFGIGITPAGAVARGGAATAPGTTAGRASGSGRVRGAGRGTGTAAGAAGVRSTGTGAARGPAAVFPRVTQHGSAGPELLLLAAIVLVGGLALGTLIAVVRRRLE